MFSSRAKGLNFTVSRTTCCAHATRLSGSDLKPKVRNNGAPPPLPKFVYGGRINKLPRPII